MSVYNIKDNTDDVFFRTIIIGLLNCMNDKIIIRYRKSREDIKEVKVPFFFYQGGDERFFQDFYTTWFNCNSLVADGAYQKLPRGIVNLSSIGINTAALTNKFVEAERIKEVDGNILRYVSNVNNIPLILSFSVTVEATTWIEILKMAFEVFKVFHKAISFRVEYDGIVVPCHIGFSEDIDVVSAKLLEFSYPDSIRISSTFSIEMETYAPIFDETTETFAGNRIEEFTVNVNPVTTITTTT